MKVVLFRINWWNIKQATIGLFTMSKVCHTGLLLKKNKNLLDASESRGNVDWHKPIKDFGNQKIIVYEIPEDDELALTSKVSPQEYALSKIGYKYNWKGIMGWIPFVRTNDANTVYCFEFVLQTLVQFETINGKPMKQLDFDIRNKLFRKRIDSDDIFVLLERAGLSPIFDGKAKDFTHP